MKKVFTLLTLALLSIGSAWATTERIAYNATGITVSGTTATMTSGLKIEQSNSKNLANGGNITIGTETPQSIKLSTGSRNFTVTAPEGNEITSITIYSYENNTTPEGGAWKIESGTEISNTAGTAFTKGSNDKADPDIQKFVFAPASSIQFSWTGKQNCCVLDVEYFPTTTSKYTLTAASNPAAGTKTISAARNYYAGSTFYLTAEAAEGYAFNNWTDETDSEVSTTISFFGTMPAAATTYTANLASATTHTIAANIADGQESYGSITNAGTNVVVEGEDITFKATPNEGYGFVNWTTGGSVYSTDAEITITSTTDATYTANFIKLFKVSYDKSAYIGDINSSKILNTFTTTINEKYADKDGNYTIPAYADKYFHNPGYVFDKWSDGTNTYESGDAIVLTSDITLTPTWAVTTKSLDDSQAETIVTWSLAKADIVFADWQSSSYGYYVQKATVNGETISIPMQIVDGKVGNYGRTDALAQTNQETKFTIPAVKGMTIEIPDAYTNFSTTTIAGSTDYTGTGTKSISYTYTGTDATIDIVIGENNQYLTKIIATYPVTATTITITPAKEYTTYVTPAIMDFDGTGLTAYKATAANATEVTMIPVTAVPAGTPLILKKGSDASYNVPVAASADAITGNLLVASDGVTTIGGDSKYDYILSDGLFYRATEGVLAAGKAYLHLDAEPAAASRALVMSFGDEATGIDSVTRKAARTIELACLVES